MTTVSYGTTSEIVPSANLTDVVNTTVLGITSSDSSLKTPVSEIAARTAVLIIITLLSIFGNSIVCVTLYKRQYLLTPSNKLVFSLTTTNFIFSLIVMPFIIVASVTEDWYFGKVWCSITGFLTLLITGASMFILAGIACDRYYAIIHPMSYPRKITGFRATAVIIVCWVIAAVCAVPPLFGAWSRYEFQSQWSSCLPVWQNELGYTLFWIILCFFFPYCTMIGCYFCIFKVARTKTRQVNIKVDNTPRHSSEDEITNSQDSDSYTGVSDSFPTTKVIEEDKVFSNGEGDSGINVSASTHQSALNANEYASDYKQKQKESLQRYNDYTRLSLPNQVECKDSPKFASRRRSNAGMESDIMAEDPPMKNSRKSSNASIVSSTSQVFRRTSLAFSAVRYYSNQMKAVFTIAFILGILLCTMGPFVVVAIIESSHTGDDMLNGGMEYPVSRITFSVSTCFFYLTCVYYPLIYGLWNRTVRKEMKYLICGYKHRETIPTRLRILSLATHIQDLGMNPMVTADIIGGSETGLLNGNATSDPQRNRRRSAYNLSMRDQEPPPFVSNKRRHTLHSLPSVTLPQNGCGGPFGYSSHGRHSWISRDSFHGRHGIGVIAEESEENSTGSPRNGHNTNNNVRRWRNGYSFPTITDVVEEKEEDDKLSEEITPSAIRFNQSRAPITRCQSMKTRTREKPATTGLFELTSTEVLGSAALSTALLFTGANFRSNKILESYEKDEPSFMINEKRNFDKSVNGIMKPPKIIITSNSEVSISETNRTLSETIEIKSDIMENQDSDSDRAKRIRFSFCHDGDRESSEVISHSTNHDAEIHMSLTDDEKLKIPHQVILPLENVIETRSSTNSKVHNTPHNVSDAIPNSAKMSNDCNHILSAVPPAMDICRGVSQDESHEPDAEESRDKMSLLTGGLLHGSNLIHLEAGEPVRVRQWSQMEFFDFFASSVAYGVVEAGKNEVHNHENEQP